MAISCLISYLLNCSSHIVVRPLILIRSPSYAGGGGGGLKIVWLIRRGNAYIFIIYHRTINQKDKLLYIDMEKKHSLSLSTKTEI